MGYRIGIATFALLAACATPAFGGPSVAELDRQIGRALEAEDLPADQAVAGIVRHGRDAAPRLLAAGLRHREIRHVEVIAESLHRLNDPRLDEYLLSTADAVEDLAVKAKAYTKLKELGTAGSIARIVKAMPKVTPRLKRAVDLTLAEILKRNPTAEVYSQARELFNAAPDGTRGRLLASIADAGSEHGLLLLGDLLGFYPELELVIISGIGRMNAVIDDRGVVAKLRAYIQNQDSNLRRECALALGRFRDGEAVELLIQLLYDTERGVQANAAWSLRNISGMNLPPDPGVWKNWHNGQKAWWKMEGRHWLHKLGSKDVADVLAAIHALSEKPTFRGRFSDKLTALLEHHDSQVQKAAATALARLRTGREPGKGAEGGAGSYGRLAAGATVAPPIPIPTASGRGLEDAEGLSGKAIMYGLWGFVLLFLVLRVSGVVSMDRIRGLFTSHRDEGWVDAFSFDEPQVYEIRPPTRAEPKLSIPKVAPQEPQPPEPPPAPPEPKRSEAPPPAFGGWMEDEE